MTPNNIDPVATMPDNPWPMNCELLRSPISRTLVPILLRTCYQAEAVTVREEFNDCCDLSLTVLPHGSDLPVLIGKQGRQVNSTRAIVRAMGERQGIHAEYKIQESYDGAAIRRVFEPSADFPREQFNQDLEAVCRDTLGAMPPVQTVDSIERLIVTLDVPQDQLSLVNAIADLFYPYGFRNGRRISIRSSRYQLTTL